MLFKKHGDSLATYSSQLHVQWCVVLEKIPHCGILPLVSVYSVKISWISLGNVEICKF